MTRSSSLILQDTRRTSSKREKSCSREHWESVYPAFSKVLMCSGIIAFEQEKFNKTNTANKLNTKSICRETQKFFEYNIFHFFLKFMK